MKSRFCSLLVGDTASTWPCSNSRGDGVAKLESGLLVGSALGGGFELTGVFIVNGVVFALGGEGERVEICFLVLENEGGVFVYLSVVVVVVVVVGESFFGDHDVLENGDALRPLVARLARIFFKRSLNDPITILPASLLPLFT